MHVKVNVVIYQMNSSKLLFSNPGKGAKNNLRMASEDPNVFCSQKQTHKPQSIHQHGKQDQLENMHTPTLPTISGHWVIVWWPRGSKREMLLEAVQVRREKMTRVIKEVFKCGKTTA